MMVAWYVLVSSTQKRLRPSFRIFVAAFGSASTLMPALASSRETASWTKASGGGEAAWIGTGLSGFSVLLPIAAASVRWSVVRTATRVPGATRSPESARRSRSEEHTSELQSRPHLVCRLLL